MKKVLIVVLAVILVGAVAGGTYLFTKDDTADNQSQTNQSTENQTQPEQTTAQTEGTLESVTNSGSARKCDIAYNSEKGQATGTVYTDGKGRGRLAINAQQSDGKTSTINTLVTKQKAYLWFASAGKAIGFSFNIEDFKDKSSSNDIKSSGGLAPNDKFSMNCVNWTVDEATFAVPKDVNFATFPST